MVTAGDQLNCISTENAPWQFKVRPSPTRRDVSGGVGLATPPNQYALGAILRGAKDCGKAGVWACSPLKGQDKN